MQERDGETLSVQRYKPDFIGIGAQKAATSWLSYQLRQHPDVWMPPRKELHYFDRAFSYPSMSYLAPNRPFRRLVGTEPFNADFRRLFAKDLRQSLRRLDWERLRWTLRYFLGTYDDDWYLSLFKEGQSKIKGEITPSYSILNRADVEHIRDLLPELKIIFTLRNPIDRAWSQTRFEWMKGRISDIDDLGQVRQFIESPRQSLRSEYMRAIETWQSVFSREQVFIGFYDDIVQNPGTFLSAVYDFLGLAAFEHENAADTKQRHEGRRNISTERSIPIEIQRYLATKYHQEIERLSHLLGAHAEVWLRETEEILNAEEQTC